MKQDDYAEFCEIWTAAFQLHNKTPTESAMQLSFMALGKHSLDEVTNAIMTYVQDPQMGRWLPRAGRCLGRVYVCYRQLWAISRPAI